VPTQQPKGQLQSEHELKKGSKHTQSTKQGEIIRVIMAKNKSYHLDKNNNNNKKNKVIK
jgi:hypothetical protein